MTTVQQLLKAKATSETWTISSKATAYHALELMAQKGCGALPVVDGTKLVGMFSERDYARKVVLKGLASKTSTVADLMSTKVFFVRPDNTVEECMALMTDKHIRHLPVLEQDKLIGVISIGDLVKAVIADQEITIRSLQDYITGSYGT